MAYVRKDFPWECRDETFWMRSPQLAKVGTVSYYIFSHCRFWERAMAKSPGKDVKYLSIGTLAKRAGTKVQTIRYYEDIGLMPEPTRTAGNQRIYSEADLRRLAFIRHARELGFSLDAIRSLLELSAHPDSPCADADAVAIRHLAEVKSRIARLEALRDELERMIRNCRGGRIAECRILEVLEDHSLCAHAEH